RKRVEQYVEPFVRMEPPQRQRPDIAVALGAPARAGVGHEIRQIVDPVTRPAMLDRVIDDRAGIADQMVAMAEIFEVVIPAEPGQVNVFAARTEARRPAHPGEDDIGAERGDLPAESQAGGKIEPAAKPGLDDLDPRAPQFLRARRVAPYQHALVIAVALEGPGKSDEKRLGPAMRRPRDSLQKSQRHRISPSY